MSQLTKVDQGYAAAGDPPDKPQYQVASVPVRFSGRKLRRTDGIEYDLDDHSRRQTRIVRAPVSDRDSLWVDFIGPDGLERTNIPVEISSSPADDVSCWFGHVRASQFFPEQIYLQLYLPLDVFEWLWSDVISRPDAEITVVASLTTYLMGIELAFDDDSGVQRIRIPKNGTLKAELRSVTLKDAIQNEADPMTKDMESSTGDARLERALNRMTTALIVIAGLLAIRLFF